MVRRRPQVALGCVAKPTRHRCRIWVIRVDIARSALSSAIHNTGHYHVRPRPVCLSPSCARSAKNQHSRRSSCVLASLDLATRDARTVTNESAYRLQQTYDDLRPGWRSGFLSDRNLAKGRAETAGSKPPTERWQDKRRKVRPGRMDEEHRQFNHFARGATKHDNVQIHATL
jgi:hypothetical protein